jgi:GH18 family chitinase
MASLALRDHAAEPAATPLRLAGYLPEYRLPAPDLTRTHGLTDLLLFSAQPNREGGIELGALGRSSWAGAYQLKSDLHVRLILCLGGWGRSEGFPAIATNAASRALFTRNALNLCRDRRIDGLDLDWEHPKNPAEEQGYASLLAALRSELQPQGFSLSVTIAAWQHLPRSTWDSVDWVHLMAYDHSGKHATFEGATNDVKRLLDAGVPPRKLILGLPFYGRDPTRRERTMSYGDILAKWHPAPDVDEVDGLYFNGPNTLQRKIRFAKAMSLGGVMIWELGQDAPGDSSLLKITANALNNGP